MAGGLYARWDETMTKPNATVSTVSVKLPSGILAGLDRVAALTGRSRSAMLCRILRSFLASDDKALVLRPRPAHLADLTGLSQAQRGIVESRVVILDEWDRICAEALKAGRSKPSATAAFIGRLGVYQGVWLSRSTLFRWRRLWAAGGDAALIDRRGLKQSLPPVRKAV